jgi:hypothetical protein
MHKTKMYGPQLRADWNSGIVSLPAVKQNCLTAECFMGSDKMMSQYYATERN